MVKQKKLPYKTNYFCYSIPLQSSAIDFDDALCAKDVVDRKIEQALGFHGKTLNKTAEFKSFELNLIRKIYQAVADCEKELIIKTQILEGYKPISVAYYHCPVQRYSNVDFTLNALTKAEDSERVYTFAMWRECLTMYGEGIRRWDWVD